MKLLFTGGHPAPALAVLDECLSKDNEKNITPVFVGRKYNNEREQSLSYEYKEVTARNVPFYHLSTGRVTRAFSKTSIQDVFRIPQGLWRAFFILKEEKPDAILSFGGYIALPVAIAAMIQGIPVYHHEQTVDPGLASRIIAGTAKQIFISFPKTAQFFPKEKTLLTGNPIRALLFVKPETDDFIPKGDLPLVYITGGSLGAHSLNQIIKEQLEQLLSQFRVVHQTGNVQEYKDFETLTDIRSQLPASRKERYVVREHFTAQEVGALYTEAALVMSRAGANTVFELITFQKPAILVPLPWSAHGEQQKQAQFLKENGVAEIFEQTTPSEKIVPLIETMYQHRHEYQEHFQNLSSLIHAHAARTILDSIYRA